MIESKFHLSSGFMDDFELHPRGYIALGLSKTGSIPPLEASVKDSHGNLDVTTGDDGNMDIDAKLIRPDLSDR